MELYLVRHAEAVVLGERKTRYDSERMLTEKGRDQAGRVGRFLQASGISPQLCESSPLVRAEETAQGICRELNIAPPVLQEDLGIPADLDSLLVRLASRPCQQLLWVGHEPTMGLLLHRLITGNFDSFFPVSKAAIACIELSGEYGKLRWFLSQKWLRTHSETSQERG